MEQIKLQLVGETPILLHNDRLANPLDKYSRAISAKSGKRKKTIDDIMDLARIEWEGGLYMHDGEVVMPMKCISKCLERGATKQKNGTLWKTGCLVLDDYHPLKYSGSKIKVKENGEVPNPELDPYFEKHQFQAMVKVGQARLLRTRPMFENWGFSIKIGFDVNVIDIGSIVQLAKDAGRLVGLCDWRIEKGGIFGRFSVEVVE